MIKSLCLCDHVFGIVVFALLHSIHYAGADKAAKNKDGWTPLMWVCANGDRVVAAALLELGEVLC